MVRRLTTAVALGAAALVLCACAQTTSDLEQQLRKVQPIRYSTKSEIAITPERRQQLLQFMQLRSVLFLPPRPCDVDIGPVCVIDIPVVLLPDPMAAQPYCVALFPERVSLGPANPSNPDKVVIWRLIPPSPAPAGAAFTFYDDTGKVDKAPGVIVLSDTNRQLHDGALGDGSGSPDATRWRIWSKRLVKNEASYIPVVVRTDNVGTAFEKVSVCGTPDPRIAND